MTFAVEAVQAYKELSEVGQAFRHLKGVAGMRPIYHHDSQRIRRHTLVAALAFLLPRASEKKAKAAGVKLSAQEALEAPRAVLVVEITGKTERKLGLSGGRKWPEKV